MNELDWWIASQWEMFKIKEGKTGLEFNKTDKEGNVLTVDRTQKWNKLRAKTDLKEMYIVRYADDFKLFCRDYATAKKVMCATKLWLAENLHLQTSGEKSGITNLRKNYTTFLGIKFKVVPKGSKWVIRSHMADKSKAKVIKKLSDVWKDIKNPSKQSEIDRNISLYINYAVASREDKEAMFLEYSELLNSLDSGATTKITINNRRLNKADFEQTILIPMADDGLDKYRKEYNKMLLDKATGANSIVQDKYVTVSVCKKNIEEARNYFARVGADLIAHFNRLGSKCVELDAGDKLRIFHDFYRTGEETAFHFDITQTMRKGHDFKDFICPDTFEFESDCFRMGDRYGRVIFLREYAAYIKDSMVAELCELNRNMMLSVDII